MNFDLIKDFLFSLANAKPEIAIFIGVIFLGYGLKVIPMFPNKWIPPVVIAASVILYPLICDTSGSAPYQMRFPIVRQTIHGLVIGVVAWMAHRAFLRHWIDKHLKNGDTKIYENSNKTPADTGGN